MTEDDKEKLRRMLRCSYWEHLHFDALIDGFEKVYCGLHCG